MVTVTDRAKEQLKETLLAHVKDDPEIGLRLTQESPDLFRLEPDREVEGDNVIEHDGYKVLLVGPKLATIVEEFTIDVQDTVEGPNLVVRKE